VREADDSHFLPSQYHYQTKQPACIVPFRVLNHQLLRLRIKVGKSSSFRLFANNVLLVLGFVLDDVLIPTEKLFCFIRKKKKDKCYLQHPTTTCYNYLLASESESGKFEQRERR
jgi:hypothetical protein